MRREGKFTSYEQGLTSHEGHLLLQVYALPGRNWKEFLTFPPLFPLGARDSQAKACPGPSGPARTLSLWRSHDRAGVPIVIHEMTCCCWLSHKHGWFRPTQKDSMTSVRLWLQVGR